MSTNITIDNLPPDVTEEQIKERFAEYGAVIEVTLHKEGKPDAVGAIVAMDIDKTTARLINDRAGSMYWDDRKLTVSVPLYL